MRSARTLLATAVATAALALAAPGAAFAVPAGDDGSHRDSSHSRESDHDSGGDHDRGSGGDDTNDYADEHGNDSGHDQPRGGMHTGGGALAAVLRSDSGGSGRDSGSSGRDNGGSGGDDSRFDPQSYQDSGRDEPYGGMHTGGGALAAPGVTAGGLAVLAVGVTGLYVLRRKKAVQPMS
ncbi:hypothetical protein LK07_32165 [Streptomyces pluripotens]|uniref:LPXTG cell wall anchor domain-containing protein n=1 Tax=Streptomyces pluripotens TaxID=1355015 RepID=A0A221P6H5_9ACTN|nr:MULTISPECIES: hypothetical protein [Streptomyces]ARP73656.1 hypothetical protein LK06_030970 [Streptomyces pluripotens]ASN27903.1 hypothetical protein LK07_32165 [Streptomyces pluripotens]KIE24382.1 hypothetical protein LK08_25280 [Streptomyces sp. MUSC 125]MCH0559493.1 hypothetical protein [Streptomyces sp. MUM 16J]